MKIKISLLILFYISISSCQSQKEFTASGRLSVSFDQVDSNIRDYDLIIEGCNSCNWETNNGEFKISGLRRGKYQIIFIADELLFEGYELVIENKDLENILINVDNGCIKGLSQAKEDIQLGKPQLLLAGGIAPVVYQDQHEFEKKYGVQYFDFGCVADSPICLKIYNSEVAKHLDEKFGKGWRRFVRKDVTGID